MHPILFEWDSITIYTYGVLVALGFLLGAIWTAKRAENVGQNVDDYFQLIFWIIISGFVGARIMYGIYFPKLYLQDPIRILTDRGGFVWYGGLIAATLVSLFMMRLKRMPLLKCGDILLVPATLGLAIGRIGCFMAGCCYGKPTHVPWAVQFPPYHETYPLFVHPTELYESFSLFLLLPILQLIYRRSQNSGVTMASFFIGYGIIRFIVEMFRGDGIYWIGHLLTASQVFSIFGILAGVGLLIFLKLKALKQTGIALSSK